MTWDHVSGKPSTFPPSEHNHDNRYYTESEMDSKLDGKANSSHTHSISDVTNLQTSLNSKLDTSDLLDKVYPKGSIYMSLVNTSPASFIGGSWSSLPAGYAIWTATSGLSLTSDSSNQISAGLPNITGYCITASDIVYHGADGVFSQSRSNSDTLKKSGQAGLYFNVKNTFNANNSNPIYNNATTTVQPPAYKVYAWKRTS